MEALRTQNDSLQWEVNRLDVENQKLRSANPQASDRLDLESELEQAKGDVVTLTEQVRGYQRQLEELTANVEDEQQSTASDLERTREELVAANARSAGEQQTVAELEEKEIDLEAQPDQLRIEVQEREVNLHELQERVERERDALTRDAELDRYQALDAERARWEAREKRVLEHLESTRRELDKGGLGAGSEMYTTLNDKLVVVESQLRVANNELKNSKIVVSELRTEKEAVRLEV